MFPSRIAIGTILLALAGGLAACDGQPRSGARKSESSERTVASDSGREARAPTQQPAQVPKIGAGPESPPGTTATLIGTWRLRVKSGADEAQPGIAYTFTADGRVTVGPDQVCRYTVENDVLSIDCAGTKTESASGSLKHEDRDHVIWTVGDKTVRLDRQAGVKEQ